MFAVLIGYVIQRRHRRAAAAAALGLRDHRRGAAKELVAGSSRFRSTVSGRALDALDRGESVLVAVPTGSGKTVVAEYAIEARPRPAGVLHRTDQGTVEPEVPRPRGTHRSADAVGLLTGDNSINGDAPVVVMTTEVLRNMIYADRPR